MCASFVCIGCQNDGRCLLRTRTRQAMLVHARASEPTSRLIGVSASETACRSGVRHTERNGKCEIFSHLSASSSLRCSPCNPVLCILQSYNVSIPGGVPRLTISLSQNTKVIFRRSIRPIDSSTGMHHVLSIHPPSSLPRSLSTAFTDHLPVLMVHPLPTPHSRQEQCSPMPAPSQKTS